MTEDELGRRILADMNRKFQDVFSGAVTNTVAQPQTTLDVRKMVGEWDKVLRNARRTQITFVVDQAHQGGPLKHQTPNDGERIEMSWHDANRLHQEWPLKLVKVLSVDSAEFAPIMLGEYAAKILPMPPYDMIPDESLDEWLNAPPRNPRQP